MKRVVTVGSTWRRKDPNGRAIEFEVVKTDAINSFGQRAVRGRTPSGKLIWCDVVRMENGDARFEHVHDACVRKAAS